MQRMWLLFAQAVTVTLGVWFVAALLRPDLLPAALQPWRAAPGASATPATGGASAPAVPAPAAGMLPALPATGSYAEAAGRAMPSVVNIYTTARVSPRERNPMLEDPFFQFFFGDRAPGGRGRGEGEGRQRPASLGSGVIVNAGGFIVTNAHVVDSAAQIEIALSDGRRAPATVVGSDPDTDLAVIKADLGNLPAIGIGDTSKVRVGDVVLAIGNPFGVGQTVTMGIVSALGRNQLGVSAFENFVQTDAAINPGNSGGALIDTQGNLIGINTLIFSRSGGSQGIGFAIPAETVRQVMEQLIASGQVVRGWLGVETQDLTRTLAESFGIGATGGALVAGVVRGGPAEGGGMRPGDVVVAIEGKPVGDASALLNTVAALKPGSNAAITLVRERKELKVTVKVGTRPVRRRS
ncbi:MAG: trypsin-like peptidase domain-containing protein [bacterium]|nr:trypsin-like peptidase domain-containing protein [Betaproteobacteria bacterium]